MGILGDISKRTVTGAVAGGALGAMSGDTNNEMLARGALGAVVGAGVGRYGGQFLGDVVADSRGLSQETKEAMQLTKSVDDLISDDLGALFNSADDIATGGQFNADQIAEGKKIYQGMSRAAKKMPDNRMELDGLEIKRNVRYISYKSRKTYC